MESDGPSILLQTPPTSSRPTSNCCASCSILALLTVGRCLRIHRRSPSAPIVSNRSSVLIINADQRGIERFIELTIARTCRKLGQSLYSLVVREGHLITVGSIILCIIDVPQESNRVPFFTIISNLARRGQFNVNCVCAYQGARELGVCAPKRLRSVAQYEATSPR